MLKSVIVLSLSLLTFAACKKQEAAKVPPTASGSGNAATGSAAVTATGSAAVTATGSGSAQTMQAAASSAASDAEIETFTQRTSQLMDSVSDIAKATTPNCPTMATQLEELFQKNADLLGALKSLDTRMTQAQKDTLGAKMAPATKCFQTVFPEAFKPCMEDKDSSARIMKLFDSLK